ncbi:hypothetical protein NEOLEDRAFT_1110673 [Neolentinus lepideus HHB14362 ss-1]|uniref:Helicase C-terminal domain-containing protein n=1 Tax=Neolentinus lepideus HHB14362 ss-1 TaxID=1314782 RepID=A0A165TXE9_9AGAM|nr:hypothetical protein NEOLEDRAFT_1110673 [Neolentinus lepideus HHB14362 ss-1]
MVSVCSLCCIDCRDSAPEVISYEGRYSLANYLPVGVIVFDFLDDELHCNHTHCEDGWHTFSGQVYLRHAKKGEDVLLRWIDFLTANRFIIPTCRQAEGRRILYVRVYIIPFDLPGVQGTLRARNPDTVKEAGKAIRAIMGRIIQDDSLWQGYVPDGAARPIFSREIDNRTTTRIYSDLPSPNVVKLREEVKTSPACDRITAILSGEPIDGLRSSLYPYQAESVAAMLAKESQAFAVLDPLYLPLVGVDGRTFYFRPADMEILCECPTISQSCGGILCEELGTGKTVMVLALILATLDHLSCPEESILDTRSIMTPLSFREFPFDEPVETRRRLRRNSDEPFHDKGHNIPPLSEILIHHIRVSPENTGISTDEESLEQLPLWYLLQANTPFYYHFDLEILPRRTSRKSASFGPRRMYLTTASLIVVPVNLVGQWDMEIQKHCDTGIRVFIGRPGALIPRASRLASDYDIVLLSHNSLSFAKTDILKLHSWKICGCQCFPGTRVPDCHCDEQTNVSPLLQIRWKRLIVDEGHVSSTTNTNLSQFTMLLSAERRWLVTGTPTTNLLGLSFGGSSDFDRRVSGGSDATADQVVEATTEKSLSQSRKWTSNDREDLRKLGTMISRFLGTRHFANSSTFNKFVITPLFGPDGPLPGAIQVLIQVMETVMIRHRIEDVEKNVILPSLHQETVLLDLDPYSLKSYNALQATIAVNAIDSERVHQDYLFHSSNVDALLQAIENMTQILFWHTDSTLFNVMELSRNASATMERAISRGISPEDVRLLTEAIYHVRAAAEDATWCSMQDHPDVQYRVRNAPGNIQQAWSRLSAEDTPEPSSNATAAEPFLQPDRLVRLRDMVLASPLASESSLIEWGNLVTEEDRHKHMLILLREKSRKGNRRNKKDDYEVDSSALKAMDVARKEKAPEKIKEVLLELKAAQSRLVRAREGLEDVESNEGVAKDLQPDVMSSVRASFLARSPVSGLRIGRTTSSKLNYILREVAQHASTEKFLVFSKMPLSLAYVAEGLDVIGVRFLQFTSNVDAQVRQQLVMTFQSSDKFRVFLMDLKHGARGLNLTAASRIIFCEPVWRPDVESQAIKRAHRIGQTRPITVTTLAIRSTSEEVMVARREALKGALCKVPDLIQESGMRHFIAHPKFLKESDHSSQADLDIALFPEVKQAEGTDEGLQSTSILRIPAATGESVDAFDAGGDKLVEPPVKKRKTLRFAEPASPFVQDSPSSPRTVSRM